MRRWIAGMVAVLAITGCGGGGGIPLAVVLEPPLPAALMNLGDALETAGMLVGGAAYDGAVLASADGVREDGGGYSFALTDAPAVSGDDALIRIEFGVDVAVGDGEGSEQTRVIVATLAVPFDPNANPFVITAADGDYEFGIDDDGDGLPNHVEIAANLNPLVDDTDGDGFIDGTDNCARVANADQSDADGDGVGDACDDVDSSGGAGAADGGDIVDDDRDDDGVADADDNCVDVANPEQANADDDALGDACDGDIDGDGVVNADDNCPYVPNADQDGTDADGDGTAAACDLDETDPRVGDGLGAVFVDIAHGDDASYGTRDRPVATRAKGIARARAAGKDVYVAAGVYPAGDLVFYDGVNLFGGFKNGSDATVRFSARDVRSVDPAFRTALVRSDDDVTLRFEGVSLVVDGFHVSNEAAAGDPVYGCRGVVVGNGAAVELDRAMIAGNTAAARSTAVTVEHGGSLVLTRSFVDGEGADAPGSASVGIEVDASHVVVINNIIRAGDARFATGILLRDAAPLVVNNTVDASSAAGGLGAVEGVRLENADPVFINNLVLTATASSQYPLSCFGDVGAAAEFRNNLFAAFPADAGRALVRDCDGVTYVGGIAGLNFEMGAATVANNTYSNANAAADLIAADYRLVGGGLLFDGIDDGIDASADNYGAVVDDFALGARSGSYDIGAMEN